MQQVQVAKNEEKLKSIRVSAYALHIAARQYEIILLLLLLFTNPGLKLQEGVGMYLIYQFRIRYQLFLFECAGDGRQI